ncbi:helix-turn-helix domain-containing protein [Haloferacaceae archaeon DSL9]
MRYLDDVSIDDLRSRLRTDGDKPTLRLVVAVDYAAGRSVTDIAEAYGIPRRTVYSWLERFDSASIDEAIADRDRPGRPRRLPPDARRTVRRWIDADDPSAVAEGENAPDSWTPKSLAAQIERVYGVGFSPRHVRRWLDDPSRLG